MHSTPLTFRQERFVVEFLKDQNASAAAARAGYTAKNMASQGNELMRNPAVRERVRVEMDAPATFALCLRVPGWCRGATLRVNDQSLEIADAILIGIEEGFDVHLIDDRFLEPLRIVAIDHRKIRQIAQGVSRSRWRR